MLKNINYKNSITFLLGSFLYLEVILFTMIITIGKIFIKNFSGLNFNIFTLIVFMISIALTVFYSLKQYLLNQIIYKFRIILFIIPIVTIVSSLLLIGIKKVSIKTHNNNINKTFDTYQNFVDLKKYYNNLEFKVNPKNNDLVKIKYGDELISFKTYKAQKFTDVNFNKTAKYDVYELDGAYLFALSGNENKNFIIKELNKEAYFYEININPKNLKEEIKNFQLTIINSETGFDKMQVDGKVYLSKQNASRYNIYRNYFADAYILYKDYAIKPYIKEMYPNYKSISYSSTYTNVTINNEVRKVYSKIDENFKLSLYEK